MCQAISVVFGSALSSWLQELLRVWIRFLRCSGLPFSFNTDSEEQHICFLLSIRIIVIQSLKPVVIILSYLLGLDVLWYLLLWRCTAFLCIVNSRYPQSVVARGAGKYCCTRLSSVVHRGQQFRQTLDLFHQDY